MVSLGSHLFSSIAVTLLLLVDSTVSECNIPLNTYSHDCISSCTSQHADETDTYICDQTVPWLHHRGGSSAWYPATPPHLTGVHTYSLFRGEPPCSENGSCAGCENPSAALICSIQIDSENCSISCDEE